MKKDYTKAQITELINNGTPCVYCRGYAWKGAGRKPITKEEAFKLLPKYTTGIGFYEISVINLDGVETVEFNELDANDLW